MQWMPILSPSESKRLTEQYQFHSIPDVVAKVVSMTARKLNITIEEAAPLVICSCHIDNFVRKFSYGDVSTVLSTISTAVIATIPGELARQLY